MRFNAFARFHAAICLLIFGGLSACAASLQATIPPAEAPTAAEAPAPSVAESVAESISREPANVDAVEAAPLARTRGLGSLDFATPNDVRLFFLERDDREPEEAVFYGYMVIGADVSAERKAAVARALACRIDAVTSAEAADEIDLLGLMTIPARAAANADAVTPRELLEAYDFPRADRWLAAAGRSVDATFDPSQAVVFVGSRDPRAPQLDTQSIRRTANTADPLVADASALSPRYLERWAFEVIQGVKRGSVQSRQDMQRLMEVHSWIETIGEPFAALMKLAPTAQAADFSSPACL